ncbi:MAG: hypothetical protein KDE27_31345 [Planctomycetes bacterium]|nr:hypothetical protein [Planctomycetota bacterium]
MSVKRLGIWILGAAAGSFLAGVNLGLAAPGLLAASDGGPTGNDEFFVQAMVADYGLSARQEKSLRLVMQKRREDELSVFSGADFSMLPPPIQNQLLDVREKEKRRIRAILDDDQRARYDLATRTK